MSYILYLIFVTSLSEPSIPDIHAEEDHDADHLEVEEKPETDRAESRATTNAEPEAEDSRKKGKLCTMQSSIFLFPCWI